MAGQNTAKKCQHDKVSVLTLLCVIQQRGLAGAADEEQNKFWAGARGDASNDGRALAGVWEWS